MRNNPHSNLVHLFLGLIFALGSTGQVRASNPVVTGEVRVSGDAVVAEETQALTTLKITKPSGRAVVTFSFKDKPLDLSKFRDIAVSIKNGTDSELDVLFSGTSDPAAEWMSSTSGRFIVRSGEENDLTVLMTRPGLPPDHPHVKRLGNLFAFPWGHQQHWRYMDASALLRVTLQITWIDAAVGQALKIGQPHGSGSYSTDPALLEELEFPIVDKFGQLRAGDWPGKVTDVEDLLNDVAADQELISKVTGPGSGLDRFGGMLGGPKLKATGFFRVEKVDGKWWFVDPDGNLFWSHGVNCVGGSVDTRVAGREDLFDEEDRGQKSVGHYWKNAERKFGSEGWREKHNDLIMARMFDWGVNTVGAWSTAASINAERIPFTIIIHTSMQWIGNVHKIADPFSDGFKNSVDRILSELAPKYAKSPWLIGVFIDNELDWRGGTELAQEVIRSNKETPARVAMVEFLRDRYEGIDALNKAWDTDFDSLEEIEAKHGPLGEEAFAKDLAGFLAFFADRYYALCREAMNKHLPNHLFLGTRFHVFNPIVTAAASKYCDVISLNIYQHGVDDFAIATDVDRPWIISEFHFGTRDHGVWGTGLAWASDADNQADLYQAYLSDALRHPNFVGTHWFAWASQTVTGRADGENFGMGLVTVVDRPVEKLTNAVQTVSKHLYNYRLDGSTGRIGDSPVLSETQEPKNATPIPRESTP